MSVESSACRFLTTSSSSVRLAGISVAAPERVRATQGTNFAVSSS